MTSKTTNKFSPEVRARAVRIVSEHEAEYLSRWSPTTGGTTFWHAVLVYADELQGFSLVHAHDSVHEIIWHVTCKGRPFHRTLRCR